MMSCPFFMYDKQQGPSRFCWNFEGPVLIFPLLGNVVGYSSSVNGTAM